MVQSTKTKLVTSNVVIWVAAMLLSFILPMIAESITDGPANLLKMMMQVGLLFVGLFLSTVLINKAIEATTE